MIEPKLCGRCVLPESPPDIRFDAQGVCNLCRDHERSAPRGRGAPLLETDFIKTIQQYRGKHEFDCLVMCSGGKDSTAALY